MRALLCETPSARISKHLTAQHSTMLVVGALIITGATFLHGARRWRRESATRILLAPGAYTQPHPRPTSISMPLLANGINANHSVWLDAGGRHIDTAFIYGDDQQKSIGEAIRRSNIKRRPLRHHQSRLLPDAALQQVLYLVKRRERYDPGGAAQPFHPIAWFRMPPC